MIQILAVQEKLILHRISSIEILNFKMGLKRVTCHLATPSGPWADPYSLRNTALHFMVSVVVVD